jgi:membrane associated rhomboid family serine protease
MNKGRKKSIFPYIPGYDNNTVLKLIFFISGAYIMLAVTWAIVMLVYTSSDNFNNYFIPYIALPRLADFASYPWTILAHGIFHFPNSFMELVSNMLWLYCFGSVLQMLVGKKQIVPIYFYSIIAGGLFYLLGQLLPGNLGNCPPYIMGPRAGLAGICAAAVTITPKYRFYLTETFSIPLAVVAGIFTVLMIMGTGFYLPVIFMLLGGGLLGFLYVKLLQAGYRPGEWMYIFGNKLESLFTPGKEATMKSNLRRKGVLISLNNNSTPVSTEKRIDDLLDKINQKGYKSLTAEEKDFLSSAGKK